MQQQHRAQVPFSFGSKKADSVRTETSRTAPIVLGLDALKKVAGGTTDAPKKFW